MIKIVNIARAAAEYFEVPIKEIYDKKRSNNVVMARAMTVYLAIEKGGHTQANLARRLNKDPHTIANLYNRITANKLPRSHKRIWKLALHYNSVDNTKPDTNEFLPKIMPVKSRGIGKEEFCYFINTYNLTLTDMAELLGFKSISSTSHFANGTRPIPLQTEIIIILYDQAHDNIFGTA